MGTLLKSLLRRLFPTDGEPEDSAEIEAREEILQWRNKQLSKKITEHMRNQA